jgi:hypothetical protein
MTFMSERSGLFAIHQAFAETEEGAKIAADVRYERYKPAEVSNQRWEELLGADVNMLTHMPLTYGLTRSMIRHLREDRPGYLTPHEEVVEQVAALIHDRGEAFTTKGDITFSDKTDEDHTEEMAQLKTYLENSYFEDEGDAKTLIMEALEVVKNPNTKLGQVFNTVERIGYVRTALRAAEHIHNGTAPDCEDGLRWIVADVFGNQLKVLLSRIPEHPPIRTYLENQARAITGAFMTAKTETFANYPEHQQQPKVDAFNAAYREWYQWRLASTDD